MSFCNEIVEECLNIAFVEVFWVALVVEENVLSAPVDVA